MSDLKTAARQALDALGKWSSGRDMDAVELNDLIATLEAALEQPEQTNYTEEKLQAVAEYISDKCHVWYGIGARDVEEVLRQSARLGLVTLNSDTVEQPEQEQAEPVALQKLLHQVIYGDFNADNTDDLKLALAARKDFAALQPRREWRSLSEEEMGHIYVRSATHEEFARAIEAALRSKNYD